MIARRRDVILVSGGAGVMGSRLVRGLLDRGERVRIIALRNDPAAAKLSEIGCDVRYGDVSDASTLEGVFDEVRIVYHLAAVLIAHDPRVFERVNVDGTRNMVEGATTAGVEQFVFVSSISVTYRKLTPYARSKKDAERIVTSKAKNYTIVRPCLAYNEQGGEEFMMFTESLLKYPIVPFVGSGKALKNPVHVDDLMRGFLAIAGNPRAYNKTYDFSGAEEITMRDLARLILYHRGISKHFITVPLPLCKLIAAVTAKLMKNPPLTWNAIAGVVEDANPSWREAYEDLGYDPIGIKEGMQRCFPK